MNIETRNLTIDDYNDLSDSMRQAYDTMAGAIWSKKSISRLLTLFPEASNALP